MKDDIKKDKRWLSYNSNYAKDHEKKDPETHLEFMEVLKLHSPKNNDEILEIGCNTGEFCWLLKKKFKVDPFGIDINESAIKIAKEKYSEINFEVKDFFELKKCYDVIYMQHVIEHIKEPQKALIKIKELLKHQGIVIITCPNKWAYPSKLICKLNKTKFCYDPTHVSEFDPVSLSKIIEKEGFKLLKVTTKPLGIPFIPRISPLLQYSLPASYFGDFIFISAKKI